jgi:hypothetical protein
MFQVTIVEKIKIHILLSIIFFPKSCRLWNNVKKFSVAGEAGDESTVASCKLDK